MDVQDLDDDGCFRLLAAIVLVAAKDARRGNNESREFLECFGVKLADVAPAPRNFFGRRNGSKSQDEPVDTRETWP